MERIEGQKLSEWLSRGPLPVPRALALATEVAEGLVRAHQNGIVHRDLKPANIMVTHDGHAKIIDFGLAKLVEPLGMRPDSEADTALRSETESGVVMGTVSYMSPEQARGGRIDPRTDTFTFGVVLYEMLSGKNPFERQSAAETLSAILKESPPPLSASARDIPVDSLSKLQRVVEKCLAKDPEERYQATKDLVLDLRWIRRDSESEAPAPTDRRPGVQRRQRLAISLLAVLLAGGVAYILMFKREPVPVIGDTIQVTRAIGAEAYPTWSPEGGRLAYHLDEKGDETSFDIWVAQVAGGEAVNLTEDHPGNDLFPAWSPGGSQIAFWSDRQGGGYFVMSAIGGRARKVAERPLPGYWFATGPQWSSNGQELALVVYERGAAFVQILSLASGESRKLPLAGSCLDLSWSPDGRYFAYVTENRVAQVNQLRVLRLEDGQTSEVTNGQTNVWSPSWSQNARYLHFVSNRGGSMDVWRQRMRDGRAEGEPERVTTGIGMTSAAFSPDRKRLAYSQARLVSNVWRVPILENRPATWTDARQITFEEAFVEMLDVSPDGSRLLVSSDRAGNLDLWMLPAEGGEMEQLTTDPTPDWAPVWSPDGEEIAFYAYRSGQREIWVQRVAGDPARQLTNAEVESSWPAWSPDSQNIVFMSGRSENRDIWTVPAAGGEPRPLMTHPGTDLQPRWSPDGKWLAFTSTESGSDGVWRARADGGEPELLAETSAWTPRWSPDGKWIYYVSAGDRSGDIWAVAVEGSKERPMTDLRGKRGSAVTRALATDGSYLYFAWQEDPGDIWVADVTYR